MCCDRNYVTGLAKGLLRVIDLRYLKNVNIGRIAWKIAWKIVEDSFDTVKTL